ncbi:MAG: sulfate/molybdate ABC transporter ATP-binding protein [Acidimicrobiia bacterium]
MLSLNAIAVRDRFRLDVEFEADRNEVVAIVGPNGAGKTTLLRLLAGLEEAQAGTLHVGDEVWIDVGSGTYLPPEQRRVGYVPQGGLLFPNLTVLENVAFGLSKQDRETARHWLERLDLSDLADYRPGRLSGGQRQLVAFARAQARRPLLLLLDEPLASVDVANRAAVRRVIRRELRESPGYRIFVTHDPLEAAALADRLVVLDSGTIVQAGTIDDLTGRPRSPYVAELVGMNFFSGLARDGSITLPGGATLVSAAVPDGPALATVHPRAVSLYDTRPSGSPRNVWRGTVNSIEARLRQVRIEVGGPIRVVAEVTRSGAESFSEGDEVWVSIKASEVIGYPR